MKKPMVVILPAAEADIRDIRRYVVKKFGKADWQARYQKLKQSVATLQEFPESGKVPEELSDFNPDGYREVVSGQNRVIYNFTKEIIFVHVVADTRRDMKTLLQKRLLSY
ncbi:Plasmid stabilization system protein [Caballeronia peredens]|nr:Plasmid stabilization system protein [Caballeronia peredens]